MKPRIIRQRLLDVAVSASFVIVSSNLVGRNDITSKLLGSSVLISYAVSSIFGIRIFKKCPIAVVARTRSLRGIRRAYGKDYYKALAFYSVFPILILIGIARILYLTLLK